MNNFPLYAHRALQITTLTCGLTAMIELNIILTKYSGTILFNIFYHFYQADLSLYFNQAVMKDTLKDMMIFEEANIVNTLLSGKGLSTKLTVKFIRVLKPIILIFSLTISIE